MSKDRDAGMVSVSAFNEDERIGQFKECLCCLTESNISLRNKPITEIQITATVTNKEEMKVLLQQLIVLDLELK